MQKIFSNIIGSGENLSLSHSVHHDSDCAKLSVPESFENSRYGGMSYSVAFTILLQLHFSE